MTSTVASALPAAVVIRARHPSASPRAWASSTLTRSAPLASRLRQDGSRKMSLAVYARRSPTDSTIGS
ncbi:Uncharacterised protein [Mycobacterium tuberculosis]|uniref:Uncharacterized protein n=1 Tax=Mycobacterium tuberculosis TaxID=1773 RepID=A0A655I5J5_MYCTX|nr:Uncharacterised protein [Mycobacterium tuberculosis]CFE47380.1 Uncharacterised protein [Mycobacterium tuberculosis]CFS14902.1 Uncharacterised protein [Mycobacterium tuberculosis]COV49125.1 Uncharacterised protein [Mycobacterium tuberculosis]CPA58333.1 Uncharacterised protein [Mycobacterium tuberculosis]